jgi:signal transduction histidine kinase
MMHLRLNLQQKILLAVAGSMSVIVLTSSYLHSGRIRATIEKDHYDSAVNQTLALGNRIAKYDYFSNLEDLQQEMQLVVSSRPDFRQIEVYENQQSGSQLIAGTSAQPNQDNSESWLITVPITNGQHSGFIKALVLKSYHRQLLSSLHREYNLILIGAVIASLLLLYLLFVYFFQISKLNSELVKKVKLATKELRAANGDLIRTQQRLSHAERMAAIGQVTASLAHEIGTPLNAIAGHLQLLARNHPSNVDTQRRLKIINAQLASIVQTVESLLERTHRRPIAPQPVDINTIIEELLLLVEPLFEARNIRVSQNLDRKLPRVSADQESLHQVFLNLVNNSVEAMPDGGEMRFVTKYDAYAQLIEVRFIDSGTGICEDAKDHLFEPMWTTKKSGSGLGLAIAREIIVEHGGRIDCIMEVEKGAEFRVVLPVVQPESVAPEFTEVSLDAA